MDQKEKKDHNLTICFIFAAAAFILNFIAFVTPYWIVVKPDMPSEFVKLGLWEACFDKYVHPEDYVSKKYSGCWYVYWPEYDYIRDWLNPPWFYAVQMMSSLSLLCNGLAVIILLLKFVGTVDPKHLRTNLLAWIIQSIAVCAYIVVIVSMGVMSKDRNWMPRPDHNYLSWSFGFAVVASFLTLFCVFNLVIHYLVHNRAPAYRDKAKKYNKIPMGEMGGSAINKSHIGSGSGIYGGGYPGGSTIYSQGGKPNIGLTSGATASAKVREMMSQKSTLKNPYGGSAASLNSLGQLKKAGSTHSLASAGRMPPPPPNARGSMSSLHSNSRPMRNGNISSNDSVV